MNFRKITSLFITILLVMSIFTASVSAAEAKIKPSTWAATDGLGRTLSAYTDTGAKKEDKFVGMFYWVWHYPWISNNEPITTGSVLNLYPEAVNDWDHAAWNGTYDGRPYFWDEPLFGFYTNTDEYILRKHAELLADADIDTVILDTTNGTEVFPDGCVALFRAWEKARKNGIATPDVMFILNFGGAEETREQLIFLYDNLYSIGLYEDLWFTWEGKPLVMADVRCLDFSEEKDREILGFFTFRDNEATYFTDDFSYAKETWGWCSDYPQAKFGKKLTGTVEQMCVSVAQNANENGLIAMNSPVGTVQGRSFTDGDFSYTYTYAGKEITVNKDIENSLLYGLNFQQQWDYAIENDPEFIFVTGFNEWIAGRFENWLGTENAFPDQFSPEYSRDIEPSAGVLKDYYYYQLVENVRRFKGSDAPEKNEAEKTIDIKADASQWDSVFPEYNHYEGLTDRDSAGWLGYHYENTTARNDIIQAKAAFDEEYVYFYVKTAEALTASTDSQWMRLLLDTDSSGLSPEWESFEYIINRISPDESGAVVEKCLGDGIFEEVARAQYSVNNNVLQLSVPREALGLTDDEIRFNFKWADNTSVDDVMSFYTDGDCAPGGRFTFVFDSAAQGATQENTEKSFRDTVTAAIKSLLYRLDCTFAAVRRYCIVIFD